MELSYKAKQTLISNDVNSSNINDFFKESNETEDTKKQEEEPVDFKLVFLNDFVLDSIIKDKKYSDLTGFKKGCRFVIIVYYYR